jgi:uncharacterized protein YciI
MEQQELWAEHARFMDELVSSGFLVLGGPLGDGPRVLLAVQAENAEAINSALAEDPWSRNGLLETVSVEPWTIRLDGRG